MGTAKAICGEGAATAIIVCGGGMTGGGTAGGGCARLGGGGLEFTGGSGSLVKSTLSSSAVTGGADFTGTSGRRYGIAMPTRPMTTQPLQITSVKTATSDESAGERSARDGELVSLAPAFAGQSETVAFICSRRHWPFRRLSSTWNPCGARTSATPARGRCKSTPLRPMKRDRR